MSLESIEKRVAEIEEMIGLDDAAVTQSIPGQIDAVKEKLIEYCQATLLMKTPIDKMQLIDKYATETIGPHGDLNSKVESIVYAEGLINERAERLNAFDQALQACLDDELFEQVAEMQPDLNEQIAKYETALALWREVYGEFSTVVEERGIINQRIGQRILELQGKIDAKQQK